MARAPWNTIIVSYSATGDMSRVNGTVGLCVLNNSDLPLSHHAGHPRPLPVVPGGTPL